MKVFKLKYLDYCVVKMAGKNQVIVKDNHGHETKVHRRDLKVIDSDTKVAEMYKELRKEGRRDAQHCMPVKQIPNLDWEKEKTEQNPKKTAEERAGPTLRSSKHNQELNEVNERVDITHTKDKEQICADFFSVAGSVLAAGVHTVAAQFINTHFFLLQTVHTSIKKKQSMRTSQIRNKNLKEKLNRVHLFQLSWWKICLQQQIAVYLKREKRKEYRVTKEISFEVCYAQPLLPFKTPLLSIFSSSGLELQLGHQIRIQL